jgi:hypothetical protein
MPRLSHDLPRLATRANRIVLAATGTPVLLRGVNRSGLEYAEPDEEGFLSAAEISRAEIRYLAETWNCDILRIPFNQDWALRGRRGHSAADYLAALDRVIEWAARCGAYTLLDLQWLQADVPHGGGRNFVAPLPNPDSVTLWEILAERYRDEPAVLFDIFNEPHDKLEDDPHPLFRPDGSAYPETWRAVTPAEWRPWAERLITAVRGRHPEALLWVPGVNWAYDLRGMEIDAPGLVYATHVYPNKGWNWDEAFGSLAARVPVFAGEWGGTAADRGWGWELADYFDRRRMGWTAWSFTDFPRLMTRYAPTAFGALVQSRLR